MKENISFVASAIDIVGPISNLMVVLTQMNGQIAKNMSFFMKRAPVITVMLGTPANFIC